MIERGSDLRRNEVVMCRWMPGLERQTTVGWGIANATRRLSHRPTFDGLKIHFFQTSRARDKLAVTIHHERSGWSAGPCRSFAAGRTDQDLIEACKPWRGAITCALVARGADGLYARTAVVGDRVARARRCPSDSGRSARASIVDGDVDGLVPPQRGFRPADYHVRCDSVCPT